MSGQSGQEAEALAAEANISDEIEGQGWRQERRTFKECSIFHMDQWIRSVADLQPSKSIVFNPLLKYEHLPQEVASARNFLQQQ